MKTLLIAAVASLAILVGCSTTPPTALEQKLFDIRTNFTPVLTLQTNILWQTNTVVEVKTITNQQQQLVPVTVTNLFSVPVPEIHPVWVTNQSWTYNPGPGAQAVKDAAGTIGNIASPGVGGPIGGAVASLIFAGWAWVRGSKANATANNLAQVIETARQLMQSLPNGKAADQSLTAWMAKHQAEAGVLPQVLNILENNVDTPAAKEVADQLNSALAALQPPTPVAAPQRVG